MSTAKHAVALSIIPRGPVMLDYLLFNPECLHCHRARNSLADRASRCCQQDVLTLPFR